MQKQREGQQMKNVNIIRQETWQHGSSTRNKQSLKCKTDTLALEWSDAFFL